MYAGFNLTIDDPDLFEEYFEIGEHIHASNLLSIKEEINSFLDNDGKLNASKIVADWFPLVNASVFLSHSHKDYKQVVSLAGYLKKEFNLSSFIDSCVWGYSAELLRLIDDEYCWNESNKTYNYQKRNRSTSHVYMMLTVALTKMLDNCECVIFLNTPNSISPQDYIRSDSDETDSPWIYSEIAMTNLIKRKRPEDHRRSGGRKGALESLHSITAMADVTYPVDLSGLTPLSKRDLTNWQRLCDMELSVVQNALDLLYEYKLIQ